jgi:cell division protein FtsL
MKDKKHKEGFDIPNDYFEEFENRLFNKINIEFLPKDSGFKVPEGYFNEVDEKIIHQVKKPINKIKVISIVSRKTILYAATIAAVAVLIFSIVNNQNEVLTLDEIDFSSIKTYIEEGNIEIDNSDLSLLFTEEDLSAITLEENYISEEILNEYLLENINDSSILIE